MTLLTGFKVVQIGGGSAAAVCGRLLADVGAQVICIDPGDATMLLACLNRGKAVAADRNGTARGPGSGTVDRARGTAEGVVGWSLRFDGAAADQSVGDRRHDLAVRRDRPPGKRSGHRPDVVLCQRHCTPADRAGGRSVGGADPSGGRAIGVHRRIGGRLCRHACRAGQPVRRVHRRVDPRSPGDARHDRARARGPGPQELGPQAPERRQWRHGDDPAGERRLCRDLPARGEAVGVVAEGDGIARLGRRPALRHQGRSGEELGCAACADVAMEPATRQAMDRRYRAARARAELSLARGRRASGHAADAPSPVLGAAHPCRKGNSGAGHAVRPQCRRVGPQAAQRRMARCRCPACACSISAG